MQLNRYKKALIHMEKDPYIEPYNCGYNGVCRSYKMNKTEKNTCNNNPEPGLYNSTKEEFLCKAGKDGDHDNIRELTVRE